MKKSELRTGMFIQLRWGGDLRLIVLLGTKDGDILTDFNLNAVSLDYYDDDLKFKGRHTEFEDDIDDYLRPDELVKCYDIVGIYESLKPFYTSFDEDDLIPLWREYVKYPKLSDFQKEYLRKTIKFNASSCNRYCVNFDGTIFFTARKINSYGEFKDILLKRIERDFITADTIFTSEFRPLLHEGIYSFKELIANG